MEASTVDNESYQRAVTILEQMAGLTVPGAQGLANALQEQAKSTIGAGRARMWQPDLRYRSLVERLPAVTFMCGVDESVQELYISPQIEGMLGFTQEEWLENPLLWYRQLHPDDRQSWVEQFAETCATGKHFRAEYRLLNRSGQIVWIQGECQLIRDEGGRPLFLQGIAVDITHLKRAVEAEEAKRTAEANNAAKSEFLARMSHEIRTPLNGVVGMIDLLCATGMTELQQRYAQLARDAADALLMVINDILDFSKIEAGKVEIEQIEFDLHKFIDDSVELLAPLAAKKKLVMGSCIRREVPHRVLGDPNRIRQIVTNLVSNALKFTLDGTIKIRVSKGDSQSESAMVRIEIEDTGIGIPGDRLDRLFKSFSQVDSSTSRKFGGTGLGLAISKRLAELMGGEIGVCSVEGKGTTFWFTIRLNVAESEKTPTSSPDLRGVRVLATEANPAYRKILAEQFEGRFSAESAVVSKGEALETLRQAARQGKPFAVALLPYIPGEDAPVWAAVRADAAVRETRLVAVLSIDDASNTQVAEKAGFAAVLHRPYTQTKLTEAVALATTGLRTAEAPAKMAFEEGAVRNLHLLVAEDNEMNQCVTRETLKRVNWTCEVVCDGAQAVEAAKARKYDAILMDCQMPGMDGLEAARRIRANEAASDWARVPIIALTAEALNGDKEKCLAAGMDGYVSKPIDAEQLFAEIRTLIGRPSRSAAKDKEPAGSKANARPPIVVESLFSRCLKDETFAAQILEKFQRRALEDVKRLEERIEAGSIEEIVRLAHNLKAVAAHVSAPDLERIAVGIEQAGCRRDIEFIQQQLSQLDAEARRCAEFVPVATEQLVRLSKSGKSKGKIG